MKVVGAAAAAAAVGSLYCCCCSLLLLPLHPKRRNLLDPGRGRRSRRRRSRCRRPRGRGCSPVSFFGVGVRVAAVREKTTALYLRFDERSSLSLAPPPPPVSPSQIRKQQIAHHRCLAFDCLFRLWWSRKKEKEAGERQQSNREESGGEEKMLRRQKNLMRKENCFSLLFSGSLFACLACSSRIERSAGTTISSFEEKRQRERGGKTLLRWSSLPFFSRGRKFCASLFFTLFSSSSSNENGDALQPAGRGPRRGHRQARALCLCARHRRFARADLALHR